jgi:hypothetical protein
MDASDIWTYERFITLLLLALRDRGSAGAELAETMAEPGFGRLRPGKMYWRLRQIVRFFRACEEPPLSGTCG